MKISKDRIAASILAGIVLVLFFATIAGLFYYRNTIRRLDEVQEEAYAEYTRLYAYIAEDPESKISNRIFKEISEYAQENGCYVEMTGQNLSTTYSKADRINIAISSKVDGIILEGDNSEETADLVRKASSKGIPVVTVLSDCVSSPRKSYIGLNNYSLGKEYGIALGHIALDKKVDSLSVLILTDNDEGNYDDVIRTGIQEYAVGRSIELESSVVDTSTPFTSQEDVLTILDNMEQIPDVIICLNERTSESAYQCIVDKNLVGKTTVLGYYDSDTILKAIDKGSVYATFSIQSRYVAEQCVNALNGYIETGFVSEYLSSDYILINKENLTTYIAGGDKNEG